MSKDIENERGEEMLPEYDFGKGERGRYAGRSSSHSAPEKTMLNPDELAAIYHEMHKAVHESAASLAELNADVLTYPPGVELTSEEQAALKALSLSPAAKSALYKLGRDACSYPLFRLFTLMDGVGEPSGEIGESWLGADFAEKSEDQDSMMHDDFYGSYWDSEDSLGTSG